MRIPGKLIAEFEKSRLPVSDGALALSIAVVQFNGLINSDWEKNPGTRLEKLLSSWLLECKEKTRVKELFLDYPLPHHHDDYIGAFYQSIQSSSRKCTLGAYYTPAKLLQKIKIPPDKTIFDPCCGSGGILIKIMTKDHDTSKIFASDIDDIALKICLVNLSLFFNNSNIKSIITKRDIAFPDNEGKQKYDYIVTNPPWGSRLIKKQKDRIFNWYPELETAEMFSIALNKCINCMGRHLYFFLPHAFLNVAAHKKIRQTLLEKNGTISLQLLGNAFKGVMSESVLLHFESRESMDSLIYITDKNGNSYTIQKNVITAPDFIISATIQNTDAEIIEKIYAHHHTSLKENAGFALGIVTGNNKKYITAEKTGKNEAIYRGKDISPFQFVQPQCFIEFTPELFQQVAPESFYRQRKIAYRFICNRLVCVLDNENSLLLNSANLFIPLDYPMETIVCLFNSPVYTFIFRKKFHSRKVLKSHLQNLPLPILSGTQHKRFAEIHSAIVNGSIDLQKGQSEIDSILTDLFALNGEEYGRIRGIT